MKNYEKPRLVALSLCGDERLCGDCTDRAKTLELTSVNLLYNNTNLATTILFGTGKTGLITDGITESDFENIFGLNEGCATEFAAYCKFNGSANNLIAWS